MKRVLSGSIVLSGAEALLWLLLACRGVVGSQLFVLFIFLIFMLMMAVMFVLANIRGRCENIGYLVGQMRAALLTAAVIGAADVLLWYGVLRQYEIGSLWLGIALAMLVTALIMVYAYGAAMTLLHREENE